METTSKKFFSLSPIAWFVLSIVALALTSAFMFQYPYLVLASDLIFLIAFIRFFSTGGYRTLIATGLFCVAGFFAHPGISILGMFASFALVFGWWYYFRPLTYKKNPDVEH